MTRIYYYPETGIIHSAVSMTRQRSGRLAPALAEMGLAVYDLTPEQEEVYHSNVVRIQFATNGVRFLGFEERRSGGQVIRTGDVSAIAKSRSTRLLLISSWNTACGIAEYTKTLVHNLKELRPEIEIEVITPEQMMKGYDTRASLIHVQYEPNLYDREALARFLEIQTVPVLLTAHYYDSYISGRYLPSLAHVITHNPDLPEHDKHVYMVQGCPVFEEQDMMAMRKRYCLPDDKVILSEFGFIMPWKQIDYFFCGYMAPTLKRRPDLYVQMMHAPYPKFPGLAERTQRNIQDAIAEFGIEDQVLCLFKMLSKEEINERLQASDMGYIWGRAESRGSSATTKEFISGRCPVVVPVSPHYADLNKGLVKVPLGGAEEFAQYVERVAFDAEWREHLRREQCENYEAYNYRRVAEKHVEVYQCIG